MRDRTHVNNLSSFIFIKISDSFPNLVGAGSPKSKYFILISIQPAQKLKGKNKPFL
jgi:hypothetical protein